MGPARTRKRDRVLDSPGVVVVTVAAAITPLAAALGARTAWAIAKATTTAATAAVAAITAVTAKATAAAATATAEAAAAAATATEAAAATAAAAETTAATAATAARPALCAWLRFVDHQRAALKILAVERCNGSVARLLGGHGHKAKALGATGFAVRADEDIHHFPVLGEELAQGVLGGTEAEIADVDPKHS